MNSSTHPTESTLSTNRICRIAKLLDIPETRESALQTLVAVLMRNNNPQEKLSALQLLRTQNNIPKKYIQKIQEIVSYLPTHLQPLAYELAPAINRSKTHSFRDEAIHRFVPTIYGLSPQ